MIKQLPPKRQLTHRQPRTGTEHLKTASGSRLVFFQPISFSLCRCARQVVAASILWDKAAFVVQVTDMTAQSFEVRVLISAENSARLFDLRREVREKLAQFIVKRKMRMVAVIGRAEKSPDRND